MADATGKAVSEQQSSEAESPARWERNRALIAHLSPLIGVVAFAIPGFIGPMLVYRVFSGNSAFVASQAKEALNFQVTLVAMFAICVALSVSSCGILLPSLLLPAILQFVFCFVAANRLRTYRPYRYPFKFIFVP